MTPAARVAAAIEILDAILAAQNVEGLFAASANGRTLVRSETDPHDLAAIVDYYGYHA